MDDEAEDLVTNAYVLVVRLGEDGQRYAEVIDVSDMLGQDLEGMSAANTMCRRMGEPEPYDTKEFNIRANYISKLWLRVRYNSGRAGAEGPYLLKAGQPLDADQIDMLVRDECVMERLRKEGRV